MDGKKVEIDGETFDLSDPEDKKRAIRAWLKARSRERMGMSISNSDDGTAGKESDGTHDRSKAGGV